MDMKRKQMAAMKMVEVMDEIAGCRIEDMQKNKKPEESEEMEESEESEAPEAGLAIMIGKEKEELDPELAKKKKLMFGK